jgi:hypothetical protein
MLPVLHTQVVSSALRSIFAQNSPNNNLHHVAYVVTVTALEWGFSAIYYLNSTSHYVMAASALHTDEDSILVDHELPEVDWLNELRYNRRWLVDGKAAVTKRMHMLGRKYIMSARRASLSLMTAQVVARAKHGLPCT